MMKHYEPFPAAPTTEDGVVELGVYINTFSEGITGALGII